MQDRVPLYPGRVKLTPVSGQENTYDMVRADEPTQEGTPLSKATFLKDNTAAMFGMGNQSIPDDVLSYLGRYNQHWWKRRAWSDNGAYEAFLKSVTPPTPSSRYLLTDQNDTPVSRTIEYASSYELNPLTGELSLVNSSTITTKSNGYASNIGILKGKYCRNLRDADKGGVDDIVYIPPDTIIESETNSYGEYGYYISTSSGSQPQALYSEYVSGNVVGEWNYVQSSERNTYPDSGVSNAYEYKYLGVPFDNAVNATNIVTGSYAGTGTYGSGNPNSLTFDFKPKIVWIYAFTSVSASTLLRTVESGGSNVIPFDIIPNTYTKYFGFYYSGGSDNAYGKRDGNTLYWYNNSAYYQMNNTNRTYYYIAIG